MTGRAEPIAPLTQLTNELVEQHVDAVLAYAYRLAGRHDVAEDLTQQAFLLAQKNLHQLRGPELLRHWLLRIVRNVYLRGCRKPEPGVASQMKVDLQTFVEHDDFLTVLGDEDDVQVALAHLPEHFRIVVLMYFFEGLSYRSIAQELKVPLGTVMSRLSRAKHLLRAELCSPHELPS